MVLIHEKISALLEQRRLKKRDLARALGVSPQTATDICKGRSAITLPHLRNLVTFFELRADFWLDEYRLVPAELDRPTNLVAADALGRTGLLQISDPERFMQRIRVLVQKHRAEFLVAHPDLTIDERLVLGLIGSEQGSMGQIADS